MRVDRGGPLEELQRLLHMACARVSNSSGRSAAGGALPGWPAGPGTAAPPFNSLTLMPLDLRLCLQSKLVAWVLLQALLYELQAFVKLLWEGATVMNASREIMKRSLFCSPAYLAHEERVHLLAADRCHGPSCAAPRRT